MDINSLRAAAMVVLFVAFIGIVWFALRRKNRSRFDEAARLPFADDDMPDAKKQGEKQ